MGFMDKLRNRFQMGKGRAKAKAGRATGDPYLETKGQGERVGGAVGRHRLAREARQRMRALWPCHRRARRAARQRGLG